MSPITRIGGGISVASRGLVLGDAVRVGTVADDAPTVLVSDTFTDTSGLSVASHTSDSGHSWTLHAHANYAAGINHTVISNAGRLRHSSGGTQASAYRSSLVLPVEYDLVFDLPVLTNVGNVGLLFDYSNAGNGYLFRVSGTNWGLLRADAEVFTSIGGTHTFTPADATTYAILIERRVTGTRILRDGAEILVSSDVTYTGDQLCTRFTTSAQTDTTGIHLDNLVATTA